MVNKLVYRNKSKLILHSKEIRTRHHAIHYVTIFFIEFVNFANILHTAWLNFLFAYIFIVVSLLRWSQKKGLQLQGHHRKFKFIELNFI